MRFTTAWSEVVAQNTTLKLVIALLTVLTACLGFTSAKLSMREPLVIERACYSQAVPTGSTRRTEAEIEAFNREMLRERFDSGAILVPGHLSSEEEAFRKQEQEALKTSNMTQRIVVNSVKVDKESISVDADRDHFGRTNPLGISLPADRHAFKHLAHRGQSLWTYRGKDQSGEEGNGGHSMNAMLISLLLVLSTSKSVPIAMAKDARTLRLTEKAVGRIIVTPGRTTILSFPTKPTKVILGNRGLFAIEYVEADIAIAATSANAHSNLFVYAEGRRYAFDLLTSPQGGDEIVIVRDALENQIKVKIR